jgi:hypothetical protein
MNVDATDLAALLELAKEIDSPHVDLAPVLGLPRPFLVGFDALHSALLSSSAPTFSAQYGETEVTFAELDGSGVFATLSAKF